MNEDRLAAELSAAPDGEPAGPDGWSDVQARASVRRARRRRAGVAAATAIAAVVIIGLVAVVVRTDADDGRVATVGTVPAPESFFSSMTDLAVLIDDEYDGIVAIDLDAGVARRYAYPTKAPGDRFARLDRVGDRVVFPTLDGRAAALPPSLSGAPAAVGPPSSQRGYVAAGDLPAIWMAEAGNQRVVQVDIDSGGTLATVTKPDTRGDVVGGTSDGFVLSATTESSTWFATNGTTNALPFLGPCVFGGADRLWALSSSAAHPVACSLLMEVTGGRVVDHSARPLPSIDRLVISPDGHHGIGITPNAYGKSTSSSSAVLVDLDDGSFQPLPDVIGGEELQVAWTPDGSKLVTTRGVNNEVRLGLYDISSQRFEEHRVPLSVTNVTGNPGWAAAVAGAMVLVPRADGPALGTSTEPCAARLRDTASPVTKRIVAIQPSTCSLGSAPAPTTNGLPPATATDVCGREVGQGWDGLTGSYAVDAGWVKKTYAPNGEQGGEGALVGIEDDRQVVVCYFMDQTSPNPIPPPTGTTWVVVILDEPTRFSSVRIMGAHEPSGIVAPK